MKVPFVDLKIQYNSIREEVNAAIAEVVENTDFVGGNRVKRFESDFAAMCGIQNCVSVGNGTDAIYVALKMPGIGPEDEVITVANTWISTSESITQTGATPVFVDIEPDFYTIDAKCVEAAITEKTKGIIPVHLYGQMANMHELKKITERHSLFLIEDCAQAHFSELSGMQAGRYGNVGAFSFYPGKNLGAYGDGGAVITDDANLAIGMRKFSNHGGVQKHEHVMEGINSRLDGIQAGVLGVKLKYIRKWTEQRIANARYYSEKLKDIEELSIPEVRLSSKHTFHLYVIRAKNRDGLLEFLNTKGVACGLHYPVILPLLPAYDYLCHSPEEFPVAYSYQSQILSLPMFPELRTDQMDYMVDCIKQFYSVRN
jgi:dTDP-4-amino-4,6-dideoxygalactose transaminase